MHLALAHSNTSGMSGVTPGQSIDIVKHSCHYYLGGLALSALRGWHYILGALAFKIKLGLSALREWHYILGALALRIKLVQI